jgi:AcrR family transcriptional regulator
MGSMSARTVDWTGLGTPRAGAPDGSQAGTRAASPPASSGEGLRERKKRLMRQQLSDTATEMFMERGFDAVRVTEVAEACGVSEKTVFNYFPTKESLVLDRWDTTMASLRTALADPETPPVEAAVRILGAELHGMTSWIAGQDDPGRAVAAVRRFGDLLRVTPALRAHQRDVQDRLIEVAAGVLAGRAGMSPDDPEPHIAATALLGLWDVQFRSLRNYLDGTHTPAQIHQAVTADVHRAARLVDQGLGSFPPFGRPAPDS